MPKEAPHSEIREVPVIPAPIQDDIDDAASKEAADLSAGTLSMTVCGSSRSVKAYTITSTELEGLGIWGVLENRAYTLASGCGSFSLGLFLQAAFSDFDKLAPFAQAICYIGTPAGIVLAIVIFSAGKYLSSQKRGLQEVIKQETSHKN